ncbi:MAG: DMT family transporter [Flavobacteriales bacterium]|nr:DMT family transporter [Flavobacteriales bacterium]
MSKFGNKYVQFGTLLLLGLIWGSAFILMKKALRSWSPQEMAAGRIFLAGLFLLPFILHQFKLVRKQDVVPLLISGFFGNAIPAFLFAFAQGKIDSAMGGMINSTTPIFTMLFALIFFRMRASVMSMNGVFLGLVGAVYLIYSYNSSLQGDWRYALLAVAGSACYGVSLNIIKMKLGHLPSLLITGYPFAVTSTLALFYMLGIGTFDKLKENPQMVEDSVYLISLALMATAIGVFLFNMLIKQTTALFASMVTYLIPGFSIMWGFVDGEQIGAFYFVGISIILTAIWLVNKGQNRVKIKAK